MPVDPMEQLYLQYAKTVNGFLLAKCGDADLAEELTQETFLQAIRSLGRFRGDCSIATWLCSIAKNLWLRHLRQRRPTLPLDDAVLPPEPSAEDAYLERWERARLMQALQALPQPFRDVMQLRLLGQLPFRQIGGILGKSENWARVTFYRGKTKLIQEVTDHADDSSL